MNTLREWNFWGLGGLVFIGNIVGLLLFLCKVISEMDFDFDRCGCTIQNNDNKVVVSCWIRNSFS